MSPSSAWRPLLYEERPRVVRIVRSVLFRCLDIPVDRSAELGFDASTPPTFARALLVGWSRRAALARIPRATIDALLEAAVERANIGVSRPWALYGAMGGAV